MATRFLVGAAFTILVTAVVVAARRRWPAVLAAWSAYLVMLFPMSGLLPLGLLPLAADR